MNDRLDTAPSRWEHGSDFHLSLEIGTFDSPWRDRPHALHGSGRDSLRALLAWGRQQLGWKHLLAPTFFCQDVLRTLSRELPVRLYPDAPGADPPIRVDAEASEVLLLANWYGARDGARVDTRAVIVEDHTHDPLSSWAYRSDADYAIASLRKTLPLPDGGVLWSPRGRPVPPEPVPTASHLRAVHLRLAAMMLKRRYLAGEAVGKWEFRARAAAAEQAIGAGEISGISPFSRRRLPTLPARGWRMARERNLEVFRRELGDAPGLRALHAPFAATLLFDSHDVRESVRSALIAGRVYPAVLWPLDDSVVPDIPFGHRDLSGRLLTVHCDFRYQEADMARVAAAVRAAAHASLCAGSLMPVSGTRERTRNSPGGPLRDA